MTINDMLKQGIILQGYIEVRQYDPEKDDYFTAFDGLEENGLMDHVDEQWANMPVGYVYSPYGANCLTIEVAPE